MTVHVKNLVLDRARQGIQPQVFRHGNRVSTLGIGRRQLYPIHIDVTIVKMDPDDIIPGNKIQGSAAVNLGIGIPVVGRAGNIHRHLSGHIVRRYREPGGNAHPVAARATTLN